MKEHEFGSYGIAQTEGVKEKKRNSLHSKCSVQLAPQLNSR